MDIQFVSAQTIQKILDQRIAQISDQAGFSDDMCRALLLKNEWNSDLVIKSFTEDFDYI